MNHYLKQQKLLAAYLIFVPLSCLASVRFALSFQPVIDAALKTNDHMFIRSAAGCLFWGLADMFLVLLVSKIKFRLLAKAKGELKQDLCHAILLSDYGHCEGKDSLSMLSNDTQTISDCYFAPKLMLYSVVWSFGLSFVTVSMLSPVITMILLAVGGISIWIPRLLGTTLDREQSVLSGFKEHYVASVKDIVSGFLTIKTGGAEHFFEKKHAEANFRLEEQQRNVNDQMYFAGWISMLCSSLMYMITIITGGFLVIRGYMSAGFIMSISQLIGGVVAPLEQIPSLLAQIRSVNSICQKCGQVLTPTQSDIFEHSKDENLVCRNVSFYYADTKHGIQNLNAVFQAGEKYLITGSSGGGKSTIAKLLAGLYPASSGKILYPASIHSVKEVVYVPQKVHIFNDTLKNNLTLGEDFTEHEIMAVLEQCGLSAFAEELPHHLEEVLGEAHPCSGGESQRIGLARAFLHRPKVLILDEVTASLDRENARKIEELLLSVQETTVISITHHISEEMMKRYDHRFVVDHGICKIVE